MAYSTSTPPKSTSDYSATGKELVPTKKPYSYVSPYTGAYSYKPDLLRVVKNQTTGQAGMKALTKLVSYHDEKIAEAKQRVYESLKLLTKDSNDLEFRMEHNEAQANLMRAETNKLREVTIARNYVADKYKKERAS